MSKKITHEEMRDVTKLIPNDNEHLVQIKNYMYNYIDQQEKQEKEQYYVVKIMSNGEQRLVPLKVALEKIKGESK